MNAGTEPGTQVAASIAAMVKALRANGCIRHDEVAAAFTSVPRHLFVPSASLAAAYSPDTVIPTHFGDDGLSISSSSAPNIMATMLEQLDVGAGMRVLEIGAGTGYNAGLLAYLAAPGQVVSVDIGQLVATEARQHLRDAGVANAHVIHGDGWLGAADFGPFDRIEATVGAWEVSPYWFEQLRDGGVLVMPLWLRPGVQLSVAFVRAGDQLRSVSVHFCGFMRLRGPNAGLDAHIAVSGWAGRVEGVTPTDHWIAAIENATPERVAMLHELIRGPVEAAASPLSSVGWTTRLAIEEPDPIAFSGRDSIGHFAFGLFAPERHSLAVFDAGKIVSFGDRYCADRLRARLPELAPLDVGRLEIHAVPHPAEAAPDAWLLERPNLDLIVRVA